MYRTQSNNRDFAHIEFLKLAVTRATRCLSLYMLNKSKRIYLSHYPPDDATEGFTICAACLFTFIAK